jgi:CRP/FNR family cyclic AMP-dependent transcriptional regulator
MEFAAKLELLRQIPYLRSVPGADVRALVTSLRERRYQAGDVIFRKGDPSEGLGVVLSGRVRTVISSPEGREQVLKMFGPGRTFADIAVFDDEPQPAEAIADSESAVVFISQADLLDCLKQHPDAAIDVIRLFASRLRAYKQMVEDLSLRTVVARVARLLVDRARGAQTLIEESASSHPEYTQDEIAAMVGSVREVVQRALKTLEYAGLIQMARGRIQIFDVDALDGWAESESSLLHPVSRPASAETRLGHLSR